MKQLFQSTPKTKLAPNKRAQAKKFIADRFSDEHGFVLMFLAALIAIMVGIAGMVIDHSREEVTVQDLQRTADAASLAGARRLNGQVSGWREAKKAAVVALRNNPVQGGDPSWFRNVRLTQGQPSFWDLNTNTRNIPNNESSAMPSSNPGVESDTNHLNVKVERGLYRTDGSGHFKFTSLETDADGLKNSTAFYLIANAVRVSVTMKKLDTFFGRIFGADSFDNLARTSISIMDGTLQRDVLPMAIPICQLMLNTDPLKFTPGSDGLRSKFRPADQCQRELFFAETNATDDLCNDLDCMNVGGSASLTSLSKEALMEGRDRSEFYVRQPYFSNPSGIANVCQTIPSAAPSHNCLALPIWGSLGLIQGNAPAVGAQADATTLASHLDANQRQRASIGDYFLHLKSPDGLVVNSNNLNAIAAAINAGSRTFRDVFINGAGSSQSARSGFPPLPTFHINPPRFDPQRRPAVASGQGFKGENYDLLYQMPSAGGMANPVQFLKPDMSRVVPNETGAEPQLNYTSPVCHDPNIPVNSPTNHKVLEGYAAIIGPDVEQYAGHLVEYCDYRAVFSGQQQQAVAPIPQSMPRVLGFVKVNIYDFNFRNLDAAFPPPPLDMNNPDNQDFVRDGGRRTATPTFGNLTDNSPAFLDTDGTPQLRALHTQVKGFKQTFRSALNCVASFPLGGSNPLSNPQRLQSCVRRAIRRMSTPAASLGSLTKCFKLNQVAKWNEDLQDLFDDLRGAASNSPNRIGSITNQIDDILRRLLDTLDNPIEAWPGAHCLFKLSDGYYDKNDFSSYEPLESRRAGIGCGALRARTSCDTNDFSLVSAKSWMDNETALVNDDAPVPAH